jgi:hypothetical protein
MFILRLAFTHAIFPMQDKSFYTAFFDDDGELSPFCNSVDTISTSPLADVTRQTTLLALEAIADNLVLHFPLNRRDIDDSLPQDVSANGELDTACEGTFENFYDLEQPTGAKQHAPIHNSHTETSHHTGERWDEQADVHAHAHSKEPGCTQQHTHTDGAQWQTGAQSEEGEADSDIPVERPLFGDGVLGDDGAVQAEVMREGRKLRFRQSQQILFGANFITVITCPSFEDVGEGNTMRADFLRDDLFVFFSGMHTMFSLFFHSSTFCVVLTSLYSVRAYIFSFFFLS